ncbi:MAG: hypothetical protein WCD31_08820 [Gillisia sp.]
MAKKWKTKTIKIKRNFRNWLIAFLIVWFLFFFTSTSFGANAVAPLTPWDADTIQSFSKHAAAAVLGIVAVLLVPVFAALSPIAGVIVAIGALGALAYSLMPLFTSNSAE